MVSRAAYPHRSVAAVAARTAAPGGYCADHCNSADEVEEEVGAAVAAAERLVAHGVLVASESRCC